MMERENAIGDSAELFRDGVLFALGAENAFYGIGRAPGRLMIMTHLHLAEKTERQHV